MNLTNEDLLAISQLLDVKLDSKIAPIENKIDRIEGKITRMELVLENDIRPRMEHIHSQKLQALA